VLSHQSSSTGDDAANYMATGTGTFRFIMVNMRANVSFAYFMGGVKTPTLVAVSNVVRLSVPTDSISLSTSAVCRRLNSRTPTRR
jgi:hypothetical protein